MAIYTEFLTPSAPNLPNFPMWSTDFILSEIPFGKSNELWLTDAVREYIRRGGHVVAQPSTDGE